MANDTSLLQRNFADENDTTLLWILFAIINVADYFSTAANVAVYGPAVEMNPIIRPLIEQWGSSAVLWWKLAWVVPVVLFVRPLLKYRAVLILNIVLLATVYGNVFLH